MCGVGAQVFLALVVRGDFEGVPDGMGGAGAISREDSEILAILSCRTECNRVCHTISIHLLSNAGGTHALGGEIPSCGLRASRAAGTWPCPGAVKKSRSLVGRAVRRCASRAGPSRPFDTKLVLCRIILMSSNQGGACGAVGPASAAASGLGRSRPPAPSHLAATASRAALQAFARDRPRRPWTRRPLTRDSVPTRKKGGKQP